MPTTTSERISMVANTGRRTQSWASVCMGYRACGCTWAPSNSSLCPLAATVSLPVSPLTMRIVSPFTSPTPPPRGALLRRLQLQLHGADAHDGGDLVGQRHILARGHRARRDEAIEGRADGGIGKPLFGLSEL